MDQHITNPPAAVQTVDDEERALLDTARQAVSNCAWMVGSCAARWTQRHARGRTDADFGELVGLDGESVRQRRAVWQTFADVRDSYPCLKFSHFRAALAWEDAAECLAWANENQATIAEMKAWRRMQNGEDLTVEASETDSPETDLSSDESLTSEPVATYPETSDSIVQHDELAPITLPDRDPAEDSYAPFRESGTTPRDQTREAPERATKSGKSDLAVYRGAWRALRQLCDQCGPDAATAVCNEATSDLEVAGEVEPEDDARLAALITAVTRG